MTCTKQIFYIPLEQHSWACVSNCTGMDVQISIAMHHITNNNNWDPYFHWALHLGWKSLATDQMVTVYKIICDSNTIDYSRKFQNSRVRPSTLPRIPRDKNMITPGRHFTVLDSSLPPGIVNLFISCTNPSSNLDLHLSQGEVQPIPPQLASFLRVSMQLHTGPAFMSHMTDIYTTQIPLYDTDCSWEEERETGWQQEATQFRCKQKVMIYNSWETVSKLEEFTHCRDIKASKVKEMYTHETSKGNMSNFELNKVSRDALKRHVIPPWHATLHHAYHWQLYPIYTMLQVLGLLPAII